MYTYSTFANNTTTLTYQVELSIPVFSHRSVPTNYNKSTG